MTGAHQPIGISTQGCYLISLGVHLHRWDEGGPGTKRKAAEAVWRGFQGGAPFPTPFHAGFKPIYKTNKYKF